jgi:hypothetical protein
MKKLHFANSIIYRLPHKGHLFMNKYLTSLQQLDRSSQNTIHAQGHLHANLSDPLD